jgi:hypothetical protein
MRRLLKDIAEGHELGDTTTLRDAAVVEDLKDKADAALGRAGLSGIETPSEGAETLARGFVGPERSLVRERRVGGDVAGHRANLLLNRLFVRRVGEQRVDPRPRASFVTSWSTSSDPSRMPART